tara:strand:+ start:5542 stop:5955 length:414 start_codon:yes stop_codon:yes gene_type:complete
MGWRKVIAPFLEAQFLRYAICAVGAMAVDVGSFVILLGQGMSAGLSAALAYAIGTMANWWLVSRGVFDEALAARGPARLRQQFLFYGTTLVGLALTTMIVSVLVATGMVPIVTKAIAIVVSFFLNWSVRKYLVFRPA